MEGRASRRAGAGLAVAAVSVLSFVVAVGSAGLGETDTTSAFVPIDAADVVDVAAVVLAAVALWALYELVVSRRARSRPRGRGERLQPWHALGAVLLVAAVVVGIRQLRPAEEVPAPIDVMTPVTMERSVAADDTADEPSPPGWRLWLVAGAGVAALSGLVGARLRARTSRGVQETGPEGQEPGVTREADVGDDPRRRVFAAYRRVEDTAGPVGLGRPIGETVHAHLRRVGRATRPGPADLLARTYDAARFSPLVPEVTEVAAAERAGRDLIEGLG